MTCTETALNAQEVAQQLKSLLKLIGRGMNMLSLCDESETVDPLDPIFSKGPFVVSIIMTVNEQQLVFIQLNFHRLSRIQDGDTAASIVQQQV
ncbi:MAG: hypothetical protein ACK55I_35905, partial [bacterium]